MLERGRARPPMRGFLLQCRRHAMFIANSNPLIQLSPFMGDRISRSYGAKVSLGDSVL